MKTYHEPSAASGASQTTAATASVGKATLVQRHLADVQRAPAPEGAKEPGSAAGASAAAATAAPHGAATDDNIPASEPHGVKLHRLNQGLEAHAERKLKEDRKKHGNPAHAGGAEDGAVQRKSQDTAGPSADATGEVPRIQLRSAQDIAPGNVHAAAERGIAAPSTALPHGDRIQQAFGANHDISGIAAHVGGDAKAACNDMGASAFAAGEHVAFAGAPDLHTAAHEAAHVVQQRTGVSLYGGVGQVGDPYEAHADAVADRVVAGKSAADLLASGPGGGSAVQRKPAVQRMVDGGSGGHAAEPAAAPAKKKERISIESKAWIPHARVVDPEEPIRISDWLDSIDSLSNHVMDAFDPGGLFGVPLTPRLKYQYSSHYRGDGHTGYAGSARAHHKVEFDWDGTTISGVTSTGRSEATHRDYTYHAWIQWGPFKKDVVKSSGTQTGPTAGGTTGTASGTGLDLNIHAPNLLVLTVAPPIDAHYHGTLSGTSLNLKWSTDNFPSHGYEVKKNGTAIHTSVVNDASWVPGEGPVGAAMIGAFLSLQTNDGSATVAL